MQDIEKSAPIAFFAYNRPGHTQKALESLAANHGADTSELFVFCDGPKSIDEITAVEEVRRIVKSQQWCGAVHVIERESNMGLANSVIAGVTQLCDTHGRVIVLEDDLVISPYFLSYMNDALDLYEEDNRVMQISGHMFPVQLAPGSSTLFLTFVTSWGWATWSRAWKYFDADMLGYHILERSKDLSDEFNLGGAYPYWPMLRAQHDGKIDSWAIRWNLAVFLRKGLVVYPRNSLVSNTGFDRSGTHWNRRNGSAETITEFVHNKKIDINPKLTINEDHDHDVSNILDYLRKQSNCSADEKSASKFWLGAKSAWLVKRMKKSIFKTITSLFNDSEKPQSISRGTAGDEVEMYIDIADSSTFDYKNLGRRNNCHLNIDSDSLIPGRIVFEKEQATVSIGQRVFMNGTLVSASKIIIGDDVMVSWGVTIVDHNSHSTSFSKRKSDVLEWKEGRKDWSFVKILPIHIKNKVWIGFNSIILRGVTIGEGSVVGAGSVITKDVPAWTIVAGNPARVIREIPVDER